MPAALDERERELGGEHRAIRRIGTRFVQIRGDLNRLGSESNGECGVEECRVSLGI